MPRSKESTCVHNANRDCYTIAKCWCTWIKDNKIKIGTLPSHIILEEVREPNCSRCKCYKKA